MKWIKASEKDFDVNIGDKHWKANGKAISAGIAFMLFKKKTGDDIEVLDETPTEEWISVEVLKTAIRIAYGQAKQSKLTVGEVEDRLLKTLPLPSAPSEIKSGKVDEKENDPRDSPLTDDDSWIHDIDMGAR
jgi:hypothetical protein